MCKAPTPNLIEIFLIVAKKNMRRMDRQTDGTVSATFVHFVDTTYKKQLYM
jgi:hypothetical protein